MPRPGRPRRSRIRSRPLAEHPQRPPRLAHPKPSLNARSTMMPYIDPHTHMISRTTDDYEAMAAAGIVAVIEPAFWIGQARTKQLSRLPLSHSRLRALPRQPVRHSALLLHRAELEGG